MSSPFAALFTLLVSLFSGEELRIFLAVQEGPDLLRSLPDGPLSLHDLVFRSIAVLERKGSIHDQFFEALMNTFPNRRSAIHQVAEVWRAAPASAYPVHLAATALDDLFGDEQTASLRWFFSH